MRRRFYAAAFFAVGSVLFAGCGGSGGNSPASSDSKQMTSFSITSPVQATGLIDETSKTVAVTVAYGTDVTKLVATFQTTGEKTTIGDVEQESGETQNDFSSPLKYTVTAQDKTAAVYTVTVTEAKSSECDITKFEITGQSSSAIDGTVISVTMPFGADTTSLSPAITHTGASISPASGAAQDFSSPVIYTVTAADSSTKKYTVTVNVAVNTAKEITKFTISGRSGTIDGTNIAVTVPYAADVKTLVPTVEITGASVSPASGAAQDFSSPVIYTVTAADTSKKEYTVTVTSEAASTVNTLSSLAVPGVNLSPAFASADETYTAAVDNAISSITVTPTVTDATATVKVNGETVASGSSSSAIDLVVGANVVTAKVTAQSGAVKTYTIIVTRDVEPLTETTSGSTTTITFVSATSLKMIAMPTVAQVSEGIAPSFPSGESDGVSVNVPARFVMAETDTTYQLWKEVCDWAVNHGYSFANPGQNGADGTNDDNGFDTSVTTQYPATTMNWRDTIVWCNALTEYYNANNGSGTDLGVVYCSDASFKTPVRVSTNSETLTYTVSGTQDCPYVNPDAKGFRLPTGIEYEFAARYIGTSEPSHANYVLKDGVYYYKGDSASGAAGSASNDEASMAVAVYGYKYDGGSYSATGVTGTAVVKSRTANALGLYDMSGNVNKFCFENESYHSDYYAVMRGGSFKTSYVDINIGGASYWRYLYAALPDSGFRFVRNY